MKIKYTPLKYLVLLLLTGIVGICFVFSAAASERHDSEEVFNSGSDAASVPDSSMYILVSLVNTYSPKMLREEKIRIMKAHEELALKYWSSYYNYAKAGEHLRSALELCNAINHDKSQVYLLMGIMLHAMIDSNDLPDLIPQTKQYYLQAIEEAQRHNNPHTAVVALLNLVEIARITDCLQEIEPQISIVKALQNTEAVSETDKDMFQDAQDNYEAALAMAEGDISKGIELLTLQMDKAHNSNLNTTRRIAIMLLLRSEAYEKKGEIQNAMKDLVNIVMIADTAKLYDLEMSALRHLADFHDSLGEKEKAVELKMRYISLRDSVTNYQQLASIKELQVMERMYAIDQELTSIKQRNQFAAIIIALILLFTCGISWSLYVVKKKKHSLAQAYESLYHKNVKLLASEESYRHQREAWDIERAAWEAEREALTNEQKLNKYEDNIKGGNKNNDEVSKPNKYQKSLLDEDTKDELMTRMEDILSKEEIVCDMDFSSDRLAQIIGVPYKYLSQVINERYGSNFSSFVNEYRIKAACRIMQTEQGRGMTIEGIANKVGFKSRSGFGKIFKSITGLSPSDYMNLSKKED